MKQLSLLFICLTVLCFSEKAHALITVTPGSGGTNICSNLAAGGPAPAFTTLGNITVTEGANADITIGVHTMTLAAPSGWSFNTAAPPTFSFTPGRNISVVSLLSIATGTIAIRVTTTGTGALDAFNIIGLQVQATSPVSAAGNIRATGATGLTGIVVLVTNFGSLSLNSAPTAVSVSGAGVFCDNTTITASLAGPGNIFYEDVTSGGTSTAIPSTSESIALQGTHTFYFRANATTGTCWGPEGSAQVTINQTPGPITATPLTTTTFCLGDSVKVVATATTPTVEILQQDFNTGLGAWTITNNAGIAASFWQIWNSPGYLSVITGDGSLYLEATPDVTGSASIPTNTVFTSPSFSTVGFTSATLTFNEFYKFYAQDTSASVEYSTDGGSNWTVLLNQGMGAVGLDAGALTWVSTTADITLPLPPDALNMPNVMLRWNYNSEWGWYWAIDNIAVNGTPTLDYTWAGVGSATGLSCTTCDTTQITPAAVGLNSYTISTTLAGCTSSGNVDVTVAAIPGAYNVVGGGDYCAGGPGEDVSLIGSDPGVNYQLFNGAAAVGGTVPGTGASLDFGMQTDAGTYSVVATEATVGCATNMLDSAVINILPLPVIAPITGDPTVCLGDSKTLLDDTTGGVWSTADATIADISVGGVVSGMGVGNTTISYTVTGLTCSDFVTMNIAVGNAMAPVSISPMTATMCHGNPVNITAVASGVTYQWETGGSPIPGATDATFSATAPGSYTLVVDNGTCTQSQPVVTISANPIPVIAFNTSGNYLYTGSFAMYQWEKDDIMIPGATSSIYPPTTSGTYKVVVKDVNGCTDTSLGYVFTAPITGFTNTAIAGEINIYPNPATTVLHIDAAGKINVTITAPDGMTVLTQKEGANVDISGLANGVYMISVYNENNILLKTAKFSKVE